MKKSVILLVIAISLVTVKASAQTAAAPEIKSSFSISDSAAYKGKYKFEGLPFEYIEVSVKEGKLYFVGGEYNGFLDPINDKKDTFDVNGVAVFTFTRDEKNQISDLKVDYEGESYQGKKEEKKI